MQYRKKNTFKLIYILDQKDKSKNKTMNNQSLTSLTITWLDS